MTPDARTEILDRIRAALRDVGDDELRVIARENRDIRMAEAERKAAALPPKLTVPMIIFFLPVLFVVILGPVLINVYGWH